MIADGENTESLPREKGQYLGRVDSERRNAHRPRGRLTVLWSKGADASAGPSGCASLAAAHPRHARLVCAHGEQTPGNRNEPRPSRRRAAVVRTRGCGRFDRCRSHRHILRNRVSRQLVRPTPAAQQAHVRWESLLFRDFHAHHSDFSPSSPGVAEQASCSAASAANNRPTHNRLDRIADANVDVRREREAPSARYETGRFQAGLRVSAGRRGLSLPSPSRTMLRLATRVVRLDLRLRRASSVVLPSLIVSKSCAQARRAPSTRACSCGASRRAKSSLPNPLAAHPVSEQRTSSKAIARRGRRRRVFRVPIHVHA